MPAVIDNGLPIVLGVDFDWLTATRPVTFADLSPAHQRRQAASHEAGHAVVGVGKGFALSYVVLGLSDEQFAGGVVAGGCAFEAPSDDQNELARRRPHDYAVMALAGVSAEMLLTSQYVRSGFAGDLQILRTGFGLFDGVDAAEGRALIDPLLNQAREEVLRWQSTIEQVADLLVRSDRLDGRVVHELVGRSETAVE